MKKIVPHLWFEENSIDAVGLYCSIFPDSEIISKDLLKATPGGDCDYLRFKLWGQEFEAMSGGAKFSLNPSMSIMVNFDPLFFRDEKDAESEARNKLIQIWKRLRDGGKVVMDLQKYDFSPLYGWISDKYGLSWQLILTDPKGDRRPPMMISTLFINDNHGLAKEAGQFYRTVFKNSSKGMLVYYPPGMEPDKEHTVMFSDFKLENVWFTAADSAHDYDYQFNESMSFIVYCDDQNEIDYYWENLSGSPESGQCGWIKDKYGISWQIVPIEFINLMNKADENQKKRMMQEIFEMKKIKIEKLHQVFYRK